MRFLLPVSIPILLCLGVLLVALSEDLLPSRKVAPRHKGRLQAWGGLLVVLGLAALGFSLPVFR